MNILTAGKRLFLNYVAGLLRTKTQSDKEIKLYFIYLPNLMPP